MKIKYKYSMYLTKMSKTREPLLTVKTLFFQEGSIYYVVCLELGIIGHGNTQSEALRDLTFLIEDNLIFRAESKDKTEVTPAEDRYFMAFQRLMKDSGSKLMPLPKYDFNSLARKIRKHLNPDADEDSYKIQPAA